MGDDRKGGCFLLVDECKIDSHTILGMREHTTKRYRGEERQRGDKGESGERKKIIFPEH